MADRNVRAIFVADVSSLLRGVKQAEQTLTGFGGKVEGFATKYRTQIGIAAAAGTAAITGFVANGVRSASNLEQSIGGVNSVFGESADTIHEWGRAAADNAGLSRNAFNQLAAPLGAMLKNAGFAMDEVTGQTIDLTQRAADMAATFGGPVEDAVGAITAALRGEIDPIERYGVSLRAVDVQARALADTGKETAASLTPLELQQARLALLFEQTADTAGQFAREADTTAGRSAVLQARFENLSAEVGTKLLPLISSLLGVILKVPTPVLAVSAALLVVGTGIAGVLFVLPGIIAGWTTLIALGPALGVAVTAATGPFGLIAIGITAAIAAGVLLVRNWETVKSAASATADWIADHWKPIAFFFGPVGALAVGVAMVVKHFESIKGGIVRVMGPIKSALNEVIGWINTLIAGWNALEFRQSTPFGEVNIGTPDIAPVPRLARGGLVVAGDNPSGIEAIVPLERAHEFGFGSGGGNVFNIHVQALDPRSAADAVVAAIEEAARQGRLPRFTGAAG